MTGMNVLIQDNESRLVSSRPRFNTFHPFPRLPAEIRIMIFHYAALSLPSRTIEIRLNQESGPRLSPRRPRERSSAEELAGRARSRIMHHGSRALTPALFHVSREARAIALALYRPCKIANFDVEVAWDPALAPYMEEPKPPRGGRVYDPGKDTLFLGHSTVFAICNEVMRLQTLQGLLGPPEALLLAEWVMEHLARDLAAVAPIESLAITRIPYRELLLDQEYVVPFLKEFKSLREMIIEAVEDTVPCDVSKQLGLEIRRRQVVLVDVKDLVDETKSVSVDRAIQAAQRWKTACADAKALHDDGWKAPEIVVKIARRGIWEQYESAP